MALNAMALNSFVCLRYASGFCLEGFPLPLGAKDKLRYLIVALIVP